MHLTIKQVKINSEIGDVKETVSPSVITKLYNCAYDKIECIDNENICFVGNLKTTKLFNSVYNYLTNKSNTNRLNLDIEADGFYVEFEDPNVESLLITRFLAKNPPVGDGVGLTEADLSNTTFATWDYAMGNRTDITSFNEFRYFTKVKVLSSDSWELCSNLESIDLSNIVSISGNRTFKGTKLKNVSLPECTTISGNGVFSNCTYLESIDAPLLTTCTSSTLFYGCTSLSSVNMPSLMGAIPAEMFRNCESLTTENLNINFDNITEIGSDAFRNCSSLAQISLPNVTSIGSYAFYNCISLTQINNLQNVITINSRAFYGLTTLTQIELQNVTFINDYAFCGCNNLISVGDVSNVKGTLGASAFENCYKLKILNLSDKITVLNDDCFWECRELEEIGDVSNVTECIDGTFLNCKKLTSLNFSNKLTKIGSRSFRNCESITSFGDLSGLTGEIGASFYYCRSITEYPTFKDSKVTKISGTFEGNTSLVSITMPPTITSYGSDVFYGCTSLQSVYFTSLTPATIVQNSFRQNNAVLYVPASALNDYQNADGWKDWYLNRIQAYTPSE